MSQLAPAPGLNGLPGAVVRAPSPAPDGARFEERIYANAAGNRTYKLFVPSGYVGQEVPLLVMLHGCKQSPDDFATGARMNELAEEQTFLVAYPAQSTSANASKCWNWFKAHDQERGQGEPSLIAGITRQIMSDLRIERTRVSIAGLSAGGAAAAIMGAAYPDMFEAVGVHSGLACGAATDMPSAFAAMRAGGRPGSAETQRRSHNRIPRGSRPDRQLRQWGSGHCAVKFDGKSSDFCLPRRVGWRCSLQPHCAH
jgi:poly(hydroxyalkanoate) depolymerase family esterase